MHLRGQIRSITCILLWRLICCVIFGSNCWIGKLTGSSMYRLGNGSRKLFNNRRALAKWIKIITVKGLRVWTSWTLGCLVKSVT